MKKIKIVWVCSFANAEVKSVLNSKTDFFASPWITELIELFRDREDIELTIISPNYYSNDYKFFKLGNVTVYLTKYRRFFLPHIAHNLTLNYHTATKPIVKIIESINPDIIHLHGSENPFYAASILKLVHKYPTLVTIQGFVSLSPKPKNVISQYIRWNRMRFESKINSKVPFFTLATDSGLKHLQTFNTNAKIYKDHYPTTQPSVSSDDFPVKKYDIVFYARLTKSKGIEDLIQAIQILKIKMPQITAIVIGAGSERYTDYIKSLIHSLDLVTNIELAGFQPTQQDVFKLAAQSKVYVLPTHFDGIPGSIRESMVMKIPVVAYEVGGIPSLNDQMECVTLVEKGNITELVEKIELVLNDTYRTKKLIDNAYNLIKDKYDNSKIYNNLLSIYNDITKRENETIKGTN